VVKHVGGHFSKSCLARFYTRAASLASKGTLHVAWIVWRKCLLIDRFENPNSAGAIAEEVGTTGTILSKLGALAIGEAFSGSCNATLQLLSGS
jgi:hypothetical protein